MRLREEAAQRHSLHQGQQSHRPLSVDYEYISLLGEERFAQEFGIARDRRLHVTGDAGWDFDLGFAKVDVKTARRPNNIIVEVGKLRDAMIYCQAKYDDQKDTAALLGWAFGWELSRDTKDFGYGVYNHWLPRAQFRSMQSLHERYSPSPKQLSLL
jgi:hypothetical protein